MHSVRAWTGSVPAVRLAALRILIGGFALGYLLVRLPMWLAVARLPARDFQPLGVVDLVLTRPLGAGVQLALLIATCGLGVAFVAGLAHRWLAPLFAAGLLWLTTYRSSWGLAFHTENLLVLHVIVLALAPAAAAWSMDARRGGRGAAEVPAWPVGLMATLTVLTYVLAGIAKLRLGGLDWLAGEALRDQVAVDNARKLLLGSPSSPIAAPFLRHPWLFSALAVATLAVELGAPLALLGGRIAWAWALAAWGFHLGVLALMAIVFPYPLAFLAYAPLFAAERPLRWLRNFRARRGPARTAGP